MQLRYSKNLQSAVDGMQKISALTWSPNGQKLAVSTADRVIHLYDDAGERKDKFPTRPAEKNQTSYVVRALAFSPDSTKLAIAQSDNIVFVYKIGSEWGERKSICNKYQQSAAVTCLVWPFGKSNDIIFGLADGKVKCGQVKSNKTVSLYSTDSYVVSVAGSKDGEHVISGQLDGSIYRFTLESRQFTKLAMHTSVPYALDWGEHICAAGNDGKIIFYTDDGSLFQRMDYSHDSTVKEFTIGSFNPSGDSVVLGNFNKFFVISFNPQRGDYVEKAVKNIENLYSVTALCWKPDGAKLVVGSLCGSVDVFEVCLRKARYKGKFEFVYVSVSQVIVTELASGMKVAIKSDYGLEITKINIFKDRFVVANTSDTLLLGDLESGHMSEVQWRGSGKEKFDFSNERVCMIFNVGELILIEYGVSEVLGTCRTEQMASQLISARLNYPKAESESETRSATKIIAYLLDPHTICIQDLVTKNSIGMINHDSRVDYLELNPSGTKLLFRDKRRQLMLYSIKGQVKSTLLQFCTFVQWVPKSEVVVAQSRNNLNVWYSIDDPDKVTVYTIKGEVEDIDRNKTGTFVIVDEGIGKSSYALDQHLIEFGFALESRDLDKAAETLEPLEVNTETEANWRALAEVALEDRNLKVAERCFAALGNVAKSRYLHKINKLSEKHNEETGQTGISYYIVQAKLAMLDKQYHRAEAILLDNNDLEEAMAMYRELHRWDELISIAEKRKHPKLNDYKSNYFQWLLSTDQEEKAAEVKERDGDYKEAINLYLKGKLPAKAAAVVSKFNITSNDVMEKIASALEVSEMHEKAGEFFEKLNQHEKALEAYVKANSFRKALDLARRNYPKYTKKLEERWGDYLVSIKQMEHSINHFIEADAYQKAIEAAINARLWHKAIQFLGNQPADLVKPYYKQIAKHYADVKQLDTAEKFFLKAGATNDIFEMYTSNNKWDQAFRFAQKYMENTEITLLYTKQAQKLEQEGKLKDAEKLYLTVNEADLAISMYKKAGQYDHVVRLTSKYRKESLKDTQIYLGQLYENEGKLKESEAYYIEAGNWNMAVDMYKKRSMWEEALKVAKIYGGPKEIAEVAKKSAETKALSGEGGSSFLLKQGLVEAALELEIEQRNYNEAFRIAETHCRYKLPDVHLSYALFLEDENRFKEAEEEFVKAGKAEEAINMYQHQNDFHSALKLCKQYAPHLQPEILRSQAKSYFVQGDYQRAEQCFLAAKMPESAVEMYSYAQMKSEAIRVARDHAPHMIDKIMNSSSGVINTPEDIKQSGRVMEQNRDFVRAIDTYISITQEMTNNYDMLEEVWERAVQLAMTHDKERLQQVVMLVGKRLVALKRYEAAADMYSGIGHYEEAVKCFLVAEDYDRAREIVHSIQHTEIANKLRAMVDSEEKNHHKANKNVKGLMKVDAKDGVNMIIEGGDWFKALDKAKKSGMLNEVLLKCTLKLTEDGNFGQAVKVFSLYGSPNEPPFMPIYKTLCVEVLADCQDQEVSDARIMIKNLVESIYDKRTKVYKEFEKYFIVFQLLFLKNICKGKKLSALHAKICVSLLRYTNEVRVDKAFYEAGAACQGEKRLSMAFVFLNRYLDLADAIQDPEGGVAALGDSTDFEGTDIPILDILLPDSNFTSEEQRERIKDWVLEISMNQKVEQSLSSVSCDSCGSQMYEASLKCFSCNTSYEPCLVTGYPVMRRTQTSCSNCSRLANKEDWSEYLVVNSTCPWCSSIQN